MTKKKNSNDKRKPVKVPRKRAGFVDHTVSVKATPSGAGLRLPPTKVMVAEPEPMPEAIDLFTVEISDNPLTEYLGNDFLARTLRLGQENQQELVTRLENRQIEVVVWVKDYQDDPATMDVSIQYLDGSEGFDVTVPLAGFPTYPEQEDSDIYSNPPDWDTYNQSAAWRVEGDLLTAIGLSISFNNGPDESSDDELYGLRGRPD